MPRKKTSKDKKSQVQKQKIAARLLEISFKADDYIYKKKSISVDHAKKYLEEVEKFEPKCREDIRSMQVIEKLTQMMKSIIEQGRNSQGSASQSSYNALNITSTNASTLDSTIKSTRSIQVQTNVSSEILNTMEHFEKNTSDDSHKTTASECEGIKEGQTVVEFNLERTLSNLSLSIIDPANKEIFENIDQISGLENLNFMNTEHVILNDKESNVSSTSIFYLASKDQIGTRQFTESRQIQNDIGVKTSPNVIIIDVDDDEECQKFAANEPSNNANVELNDKMIYKDTDKPKKPEMQTNQKESKQCIDSVKKQEDVKKGKKKAKDTKPKRVRRNSKINTDTILTEDTTANKNRRRRNRAKEIVCDLTWVENIKFVRAVEPSEYDTSFGLNCGDSFWDNCYLPHDFSEYF